MRKEVSRSASLVNAAAAAPLGTRVPRRARLWVICDEEASLTDLGALLRERDAVLTKWAELHRTQQMVHGVEVVVIDLSPQQLTAALKLLREALGCQEAAILVTIRGNPALHPTGLLPRYRAMACCWNDRLRLTQSCLHKMKAAPPARSLL